MWCMNLFFPLTVFISLVQPFYWGMTDTEKAVQIQCRKCDEFGDKYTPMKPAPQSRPLKYPCDVWILTGSQIEKKKSAIKFIFWR